VTAMVTPATLGQQHDRAPVRHGSPGSRRSIDEVLAEARSRLDRLSPTAARAALAVGAVLVDIRPAAQRAVEGEVPEALLVERNVLEWRFDPASAARLPIADYDLHVIILCQEGYTSSLAAAALQDLGVHRATDVVGGVAAWRQLQAPESAARGQTPA
jgi:rhodanese-related sulfurtransferase